MARHMLRYDHVDFLDIQGRCSRVSNPDHSCRDLDVGTSPKGYSTSVGSIRIYRDGTSHMDAMMTC